MLRPGEDGQFSPNYVRIASDLFLRLLQTARKNVHAVQDKTHRKGKNFAQTLTGVSSKICDLFFWLLASGVFCVRRWNLEYLLYVFEICIGREQWPTWGTPHGG